MFTLLEVESICFPDVRRGQPGTREDVETLSTALRHGRNVRFLPQHPHEGSAARYQGLVPNQLCADDVHILRLDLHGPQHSRPLPKLPRARPSGDMPVLPDHHRAGPGFFFAGTAAPKGGKRKPGRVPFQTPPAATPRSPSPGRAALAAAAAAEAHAAAAPLDAAPNGAIWANNAPTSSTAASTRAP